MLQVPCVTQSAKRSIAKSACSTEHTRGRRANKHILGRRYWCIRRARRASKEAKEQHLLISCELFSFDVLQVRRFACEQVAHIRLALSLLRGLSEAHNIVVAIRSLEKVKLGQTKSFKLAMGLSPFETAPVRYRVLATVFLNRDRQV